MLMKELQSSWEAKESGLQEREATLNGEFERRCETMKAEYERVSAARAEEVNSLKERVEELSGQLEKERERARKKLDAKDLECKTASVSVESLKSELVACQKELKQAKSRVESVRAKEKERERARKKLDAKDLECKTADF